MGDGNETNALKEILQMHLSEQRRSRRWKIFFRLLFAAYVGMIMFAILPNSGGSGSGSGKDRAIAAVHVAVIDVKGEIAAGSRQGASAENLIKSLDKAFAPNNAVAAVILRINSPGGSPVQSGQVYRHIMDLKAQHPGRPVYAVAEDMAASGAYYIASAADKIYADPASLVGSVGVIMGGFGFTDVMEKVGVERRVYTAGKNKAFMDPFSPVDQSSLKHTEHMLSDIHEQFIAAVRKGRGDRIKGTDEDLFNGLIWTGNQAIELGLIDGFGSVQEVAKMADDSAKIVNYSRSINALERLVDRLGASVAAEATSIIAGPGQLR